MVKILPDGTYLSVLIDPKLRTARPDVIIQAARDGQDLDPETARLVRVIEYDVPGRAGAGHGELIVLLSTITDPEAARPDELAVAYNERWEEETANDQLKTHLRGPGRVLRSRLGDLARQEIWAWLAVHYAISVLIARAAQAVDKDPDRISYARALRIIRRGAAGSAASPPEHWHAGLDRVLTNISRKLNPERPQRTCPRALKRLRHNSYRAKKPDEPSSTRHEQPATIKSGH